ncbi:hypothetical protein PMAYCL1PPCAC_21219, partial [Pristionchus mayeri]
LFPGEETGSVMSLIPLIYCVFFALLVGGAHGFVFSCNEIKNKLINQNLQEPTRFVCLMTQDGYKNLDSLKSIYAQSDKISVSFADLLNNCAERPSNGPWRIVADLPITLDCEQELSLIFTSSPSIILHEPGTLAFNGEVTIVRPETGIRINNKQCTGSGNVTIFTGAGSGVAEYRFPMTSWTCAEMPDWIVSFESVISVTIDSGVDLTAELSWHDHSSEIIVSHFDRMAVMSSGRSDDVQLLEKYINSVTFKSSAKVPMSVRCDSHFENGNYLTLYTDSIEFYSDSKNITSGEYAWSDTASLFEIDYKTTPVASEDLWNNQDNFVCEFTLGGAALVVSTTQATNIVGKDPYCQCGLTKFGMPEDNWNPSEIWVDIAIILDTSEAMGSVQLINAASLIDSFFGTDDEDVLTTNTTAKFYTRVGLIAMSDKAE